MFQSKSLAVVIATGFSMTNAMAEGQEGRATDISGAPVVVTASRIEQNSFDLPVSIDTVSKEQIQDQQLQVNASETLQHIPGIVVQNRQNYSQDLQISSRGFGARTPFGVKGVRLIADGIPITMPDGQGQASIFNLSSAKRIEVMRGPFSAMYGNGAGGVIQAITEDGPADPTLTATYRYGSDNTQRVGVKFGGQAGPVNYLLDHSWFRTDGYRDHSAADRDQFNGKINWAIDENTTLRFVGNTLYQPDTQDPLGLTSAQVAQNRRQAQSSAITFNTRKTIQYQHAGLVLDHSFTPNTSLQLTGYYGQRNVVQLLSFQANGVVDLDRYFGGLYARITHSATLLDRPLTIAAGIENDRQNEIRKGYNNNNGVVSTAMTRNEDDTVVGFNQYLQIQYQLADKWSVTGGLRHNDISFNVDDHYFTDGNNSAKVSYTKTTPTLGVVFQATPAFNVYANAGQGFETPTFAELAYTSNAAGTATLNTPNIALRPARSMSYETGIKTLLGSGTKLNLALFQTRVKDEIAPMNNVAGRFVYTNIPKTKREGIELSLDNDWGNGLTSYLAYTYLSAYVDEAYTKRVSNVLQTISTGSRIPGVPKNTLYAETQWKHMPSGLTTAIELRYNGKVYADDLNTNADALSKAYTVINWRAGLAQRISQLNVAEFLRIDNIFNREYNGSVIVDENSKRYFEPASKRTWLLGFNASYQF